MKSRQECFLRDGFGALYFRTIQVGAVLVVLLSSLPVCGAAQAVGLSEYEVKAAFLLNFARFFEWPGDALGQDDHPFTICVLGENTVGQRLQQFAKGKFVGGHPLQARVLQRFDEVHGCQILFLSSGGGFVERSLGSLAEEQTLTVGESPGFCSRGGIVNFWTEADHIRFEVNPKAADRAHLHVSSKLLRLARIVEEPAAAGGGH